MLQTAGTMTTAQTALRQTTHPSLRLFLPELEYSYSALEPCLSETALTTHHSKHHARYVDAANRLLAEQGAPARSLEDLLDTPQAQATPGLFNNAAQAWNHGFFWKSMTGRPARPMALLARAIAEDFGTLDELKSRFVAEGSSHFGSGWVWLAAKGPRLAILSTHDAGTLAAARDMVPLLVCDVWEHAYYLDYRQDRGGWLTSWLDRLANWEFAEAQYSASLGSGGRWRYPVAAGV
jgi:Fe-Mn family superoxide dismutase